MNEYQSKKRLVYSIAAGIFVLILIGWLWLRPYYSNKEVGFERQGFFSKIFSDRGADLKDSVEIIKTNTKEVLKSKEAEAIKEELNIQTNTTTPNVNSYEEKD